MASQLSALDCLLSAGNTSNGSAVFLPSQKPKAAFLPLGKLRQSFRRLAAPRCSALRHVHASPC